METKYILSDSWHALRMGKNAMILSYQSEPSIFVRGKSVRYGEDIFHAVRAGETAEAYLYIVHPEKVVRIWVA